MNKAHLEKLAATGNAEELRRAIEALCEPLGKPKNIRVVPYSQSGEYVCLLELGAPELNASIIEDFGGFYFANGVAFRVPIKQTKQERRADGLD